jgi:hypothetical protein
VERTAGGYAGLTFNRAGTATGPNHQHEMRRPRLQVLTVPCKRCGTMVSTLSRPIHGSTAVHARLSGVCGKCITPEEEHEILEDQASGILGRKVSLPRV